MFFKQVYRNAAKNRKGSGLFFGSLVIAIVAFYTLLSLGEQDVMRFLATVESDAVKKLLALLPVVYVISLFFVFFLVYFACKYQTDNRRREFGMYLMLGMKRSRLFFMLFCETVWSSLVSLLIGLPVSVFLTEGISLATAKLVGLGLIGHRFSLSIPAILWTVCGFVLVQMFAMLIICIPFGRTEPAELLRFDASKRQTEQSKAKSSAFFVLGILLLLTAYYLGIFHLRNLDITVLILLLSGILGTFSLYRGLGGFLGRRIHRKAPDARGLATFTGRQVQENVIHQHQALAVSSLLLLMALTCVSYGISLGIGRATDTRSTDFSIFASEAEIEAVLEDEEIHDMIRSVYPVYLSRTEAAIDDSVIKEALRKIDGGEAIAQSIHWDYVISQGSYNQMMAAMGKDPIDLDGETVALFSSMGREGDFFSILDRAVEGGASIQMNGREYSFYPSLCYDNIVADRAITLYAALIVPDPMFAEIALKTESYCQNVHLTDAAAEEMGLMQAIQKVDGKLDAAGLEYDSFLAGIGRNLFYTVSASYLTIYLGILFLLIANTVIGLKYLIGQRQNKHRYLTLLTLGAGTEELCSSAKKQIQTFFSLVLAVAVISSAAAIVSMFTGLTKLPIGTSAVTVITLAGIALLVFVLTEAIYIHVVKKTACREICSLEKIGGRGVAS